MAEHTANPFPVMKTGVPAMRTGVPCNENRFFPVWKTSQGIPCSGPVLALYRIAVHVCSLGTSQQGNYSAHWLDFTCMY